MIKMSNNLTDRYKIKICISFEKTTVVETLKHNHFATSEQLIARGIFPIPAWDFSEDSSVCPPVLDGELCSDSVLLGVSKKYSVENSDWIMFQAWLPKSNHEKLISTVDLGR